MATFNLDTKEKDPRAFELYRVQHTTTKLYWDSKGFNVSSAKKAVLVDFRLLAVLKSEHVHIKEKLIIKDKRKDSSWAHLVPKSLSACNS
jgi:hypothetical protein